MGENIGRPKGTKNSYPYRRKAKKDSVLERAWKSMRIMRMDFSIPVILMTSSIGDPGPSDERYLQMWLRWLLIHGYIRKTGTTSRFRRAGEYQTFALVKDQIERPLYCDACGQSILSKVCDPSLLKKETKKKRKKETKTEKQEACGCEDVCHSPEEKIEVGHE